MAAGYREAMQVATLGAALFCLNPSFGHTASQQVDLELVLAIDVSSSIDSREYVLQTKGLASAFRSPEVAQAIKQFAPRGIAVTVLQWASETDHRQAVGWRRIDNRADGTALAEELDRMRRIGHEGVTAIGAAIHRAHALFRDNGFQGTRRVIDVSGDGILNQGPPIEPARQRAIADGITINGLAIVNEEPNLTAYYRANVIGGSRAFVMTALDYSDFARAIRAKLVREISNAQLAVIDAAFMCAAGSFQLSSIATERLPGGSVSRCSSAKNDETRISGKR